MTTLIERLTLALPHVPAKRTDFAKSLIEHYVAFGKLSEKQWYWVETLAVEAEGAALGLTPPPETEAVGDLTGLVALFKTAGSKLSYPTIVLKLPSGSGIKLYVASAKSKTPGHIQIKGSSNAGSNMWLGRVSPDGDFFQSPFTKSMQGLGREITTLLKAMSVDPAGTAAAYGKMTGCCAFCGKPLKDEKSVHAGYGPVCATNYNLPWGKKA